MKVSILSEVAIKVPKKNLLLKRNLFRFFSVNMRNSIKNKEDFKGLEELEDLQLKVEQVRLVEKLSKQGYQYDIKELFEPFKKVVADSDQKLPEETKSNTKAKENPDESKK